VEAARKATDLVLDELQSQRDTPDQELLDELGWTPEQLRRFTQRWEQARKLADDGSAENRKQFEESLKSLGIRPDQMSDQRRMKQQSDALPQIRDSGQRMAPPRKFRDSLEAFKRSLNK
jgi:hypothetical protein